MTNALPSAPVYNYQVVTSLFEGTTEVYGIKAEMYERGRLVRESSLDDIFCTRTEAEEFAELLSENKVDPCHLTDVAEDWLVR